ncbi:MAG: GNAT family N-acetyltransferase [Marmoricola sp.]
MEVTTRLADPVDAPVLAALLIDFNQEFDAPAPPRDILTQRFRRILAEPAVIAVLAEAERPIGFALLTLRPTPYHEGPLAQLDELYVVPDSRGSGIGSLILGAALATLTDRGVHEMHINVDEIDADARRFYERHGFTNIEPGADYRMLCYLKEF